MLSIIQIVSPINLTFKTSYGLQYAAANIRRETTYWPKV